MSYDDIATLGFKADTTELEKAASALDKMFNKADSAEKATDKLKKSTIDMVDAVKAATQAFAAWEVTKFGGQVLEAAARFETLGVVMDVAGQNAGYMASQMREFEVALNKQGITAKESRTTLTQLAAAHVDLSKASELARGAQDLAVVGGINSSEAFQRMVIGIQRGDTEVLRSIGINVQWEKSYEALAAKLGKASSAMSEQEKIEARTNAVMSESIKYTGIYEAAMATAGKQLTSMPRYFSDISVSMGTVGLTAFSTGIQYATDKLKSLDDWLKELVKDGTIESWGSKLNNTLTLVASNLDSVVVALVAYKAATMASTAYTALASLEVGKLASSFGALVTGSPLAWFVATATVLYTMTSRINQADAETRKLADAFQNVATATDGAEKSADRYAGTLAKVALSAARNKIEEDQRAMAKASAKLLEIAKNAQNINSEVLPDLADIQVEEPISPQALEVINAYKYGVKDAENALNSLLDLESKGVDISDKASQTFILHAQAVLGASRSYELAKKKYEELKKTMEDRDAAAGSVKDQEALQAVLDDITKAMTKYHESLKVPSTAEESVVFLLKYTNQSKLAEKAQKDLAKAQAAEAWTMLNVAAEMAAINGETEKFIELCGMIEKFEGMLNLDFSIKDPKNTGGADKAAEAQLKLNEELAKVKGTNAIAAYDEIAKKIHDFEKDLGKTTPQVKELNQLLVQKADYDLLQDILKHTDPVAAGIASVSKEYQELLKNIDAAHSKGLISDDEAASMAKKAEGWKKAQEIDQQNSLLTQQLDLVQKIIDLGGSSTLSVKLQNQQIDAMAEKIRALFPEVSSLVDEWQKLAKKEINSPEAAIKRQIDALRKQRDAWSGVEAAALQYNLDATNYCQQTENIFRKVMDGMTDALTNFVMTGKLSFADLANEFIKQVIRMQAQAVVSGLFNGITSAIGGMLAPSAGTPTSKWSDFGYTPGPSMPVPGLHNGGLVGSSTETFNRNLPVELFAGAQRFHSGGGYFAHDEYPAVLQKGELVLNTQDTQAYLAGRSSGASVVNMYGAGNSATPVTQVTNNIQIVPPDGYTASESRSNNGGGGENIRITFSKMMAAEAASYGSPLNNTLRRQGMKTPVVRQG